VVRSKQRGCEIRTSCAALLEPHGAEQACDISNEHSPAMSIEFRQLCSRNIQNDTPPQS